MIAKVEKKIIAAILLLAMLLGIPFGPAIAAEPLLSIKDLAIPPSLGKIEHRFQGTGSRWVIHIQDVHAHLTAQQNIAAIVDHLNAVYGIRTLALEGGWDQTSFPESWALPASREKQMLVGALLEDAYITGPAYAAIFAQTPVSLVGLEDERLYEENRRVYLQHFKKRAETTEKINAFSQKISAAKKTVFNPELQSFDRILMDYREGKKADKFIPALLALTDQKKAGLSDLDQIQIFKKAMEIERSIQKDKLESEAKRLEGAYKRKRVHFEELLRANIIPKDKLEFYPESQKYLELIKIQDSIKHKALFAQMEEAIQRLKEKLFTAAEEKALDAESERFLVAKKILLFQATPDDLKVYEGRKEIFRTGLEEGGLGEALDLALEFYRLAKKRDDIFFEKITKDQRLQGDVAVVTGGFHTEGLSERFAAQGISYLVITPDLGKEPANEKIYFERLSENPAGRQVLSEIQNRLFRPEFDQGIAVTVPRMKGEIRDLRIAEQAALSYQTAAKPDLVSPIATADFKMLAPQRQAEIVQDYLKMQTGKLPVTIVIKRSELRDLLKNPVALTAWQEHILAQRENRVIIIPDIEAVLDAEIGGAAVVRRPANTLEAVVQQEKSRGVGGKRILIGVIDSRFQPVAGVLVLKPLPAALLLLRPILEYGANQIPPFDPEVLAIVQDILRTIYQKEGTLRSA